VSVSIDVVVPTYDGWELPERCLVHLGQQTVSHNVIVADDGSTDGTPEAVARDFPAARLVETGANRGFSMACNRGAEAGDGDVIVLLNNDVDCPPDFLERRGGGGGGRGGRPAGRAGRAARGGLGGSRVCVR
jgi:N-acetylglucosaminyl-diphospho-decaprenol L-rhamnosyltransferase